MFLGCEADQSVVVVAVGSGLLESDRFVDGEFVRVGTLGAGADDARSGSFSLRQFQKTLLRSTGTKINYSFGQDCEWPTADGAKAVVLARKRELRLGGRELVIAIVVGSSDAAGEVARGLRPGEVELEGGAHRSTHSGILRFK